MRMNGRTKVNKDGREETSHDTREVKEKRGTKNKRKKMKE